MSKYEGVTDRELIENLRAGDSSIMNYFLEKYKGLVRKKAKAMFLFGGDNDDLIQEGMIGLFNAVQDYNTEMGSSFYSFAELCIARQMYSAIEASKRKKHGPLNSYVSIYGEDGDLLQSEWMEDDTEMNGNPEKLVLGKEYQEGLELKLRETLSDLENHVLELHLQGEDYRSIAQQLGNTPKGVDNALQRIKNKANKILDKL